MDKRVSATTPGRTRCVRRELNCVRCIYKKINVMTLGGHSGRTLDICRSQTSAHSRAKELN